MADKKSYTTHDKLSLDAIAKLIAELDLRPGDNQRTAEDPARKRIVAALKKGKLIRERDSTFIFGNLVEWARGIWPDKFDNLPSAITAPASQFW